MIHSDLISADPILQQGERIKEEITSSKGKGRRYGRRKPAARARSKSESARRRRSKRQQKEAARATNN